MFAPPIGVPEDIANADSTACLATLLAARDTGGTRSLKVEIGDSLGRPATIGAQVVEGRVRLSGRASVRGTAQVRVERHTLH